MKYSMEYDIHIPYYIPYVNQYNLPLYLHPQEPLIVPFKQFVINPPILYKKESKQKNKNKKHYYLFIEEQKISKE